MNPLHHPGPIEKNISNTESIVWRALEWLTKENADRVAQMLAHPLWQDYAKYKTAKD